VKVEKLAKNGQKGQNSQPLSPGGCRTQSDGAATRAHHHATPGEASCTFL